jgi:hypothetical protein
VSSTPLYDGNWWSKRPHSVDYFVKDSPVLAMMQGGSVATVSRKSEVGTLPLVPGNKSFYVEFEAKISENDRDHWPALWMMPIEHNAKRGDHYQGDPDKFERWLEIDVDEGGFSPGTHGVAISWSGIWPNYDKKISSRGNSREFLDRTVYHRFGVSFDARERSIQWWLDGKAQHKTDRNFVPDITALQNYYLLMGAQSHGKKTPYVFYVSHIFACNLQ